MRVLLDEVARESPDAVYVPGGEIFVDSAIAHDLVHRAEKHGIAILGLEGFLIDESTGAVYPSLARIADFSRTVESDRNQFVSRTCAEALETMAEWSDPPAAGHGMSASTQGRHMLATVVRRSAQSCRLGEPVRFVIRQRLRHPTHRTHRRVPRRVIAKRPRHATRTGRHQMRTPGGGVVVVGPGRASPYFVDVA